jgi:uncharacterized membrane protein HdeD (DUF308 family)
MFGFLKIFIGIVLVPMPFIYSLSWATFFILLAGLWFILSGILNTIWLLTLSKRPANSPDQQTLP